MPQQSLDEIHLVFIVSGPGVYGLGWGASLAKKLESNPGCVVVRSWGCRGWTAYCDGLEQASRRVAKELIEAVHMTTEARKTVTAVSLVGEGIGGLAARLSLEALGDWPGSVDYPFKCFITVDTPHLGCHPFHRAPMNLSSVYKTQLAHNNEGYDLLGATVAKPAMKRFAAFQRRVLFASGSSCKATCLVQAEDGSGETINLADGLEYIHTAAVPFGTMSLPPSRNCPTEGSPAEDLVQIGPVDTKGFVRVVSEVYIAGAAEEVHVRKKGDVNGKDMTIEGCQSCTISVYDRCGTLSLHRNNSCTITCGPVSTSTHISDCYNCTVYVPSLQVTVKNSHHLRLKLYTCQSPVLEGCSNITISPFSLRFPHLASLWTDAGLPPERGNLYADPQDLSKYNTTFPTPRVSVDRTPPYIKEVGYDGTEKPELPLFVERQLLEATQEATSSAVKKSAISPIRCQVEREVKGVGRSWWPHLTDWMERTRVGKKNKDAPENTAPQQIPLQLDTALSPLRHRAAQVCREGVQSDCWVSDAVGQNILRYNMVKGDVIGMKGCEACRVIVTDWTMNVLVENCKDCVMVFNPVAESIVVSGSERCTIFCCAGAVRLRDCTDVTVYAWTNKEIIAEGCNNLLVAPWSLSSPKLEEAFTEACLDPSSANQWYSVRPVSGTTHTLKNPIPTQLTPLVVDGLPQPTIPKALHTRISLTTYFPSARDANLQTRLNEALMTLNNCKLERRTAPAKLGDLETDIINILGAPLGTRL
eukprot:TRINITY_DN22865_c0_g1_i1.p1 TRINITY_DN22865_c0_g1~~TRINITY_DN22865_c0_g1_i1.p1  ORF type:complete len:765 (+),score=114.69 TRINITY_DN22865_c0_g1_i1:26-2296(+)